MRWLRSRSIAPFVLGCIGTVLFAVASGYHAVETRAVEQLAGPLAALAVDGLPPLSVVYAAYRLRGTELSSENRWVLVRWCLAGAIAFSGVVEVSVAVRLIEGRAVTEPTFELLLAVNVGALAGTVTGYQTARVRDTADRARRAKRVVGVVDGILRHDLRNDLTVVRGRADLLEGETDGSAAEHTAVIRRKADEALDRIEETGATTETLLGEADVEHLDLVEVVTGATTALAANSDATVTTDLPESAPVRAGRGIHSVVDNVLENAVEHADSADPSVDVTVERFDDAVRLEITDDGPGTPPAEREALVTAREDVPQGGLALSKLLVEAYGGELRIADAEPTGTTVVAELPGASR
jgi:signal transduction histidine kinase